MDSIDEDSQILLKDVRYTNGETLFLYDINGVERWLSHYDLNVMKIKLPIMFRNPEKNENKISTILHPSKKLKQQVILDEYSKAMNELRRALLVNIVNKYKDLKQEFDNTLSEDDKKEYKVELDNLRPYIYENKFN